MPHLRAARARAASLRFTLGGALILVGDLSLNQPAAALSPLSPKLEPASQQQLHKRLRALDYPEVAEPSVLLGLTSALGLKAESHTQEERSRYAHLPSVRTEVQALSATCAQVRLQAWFSSQTPNTGLEVQGRYCLQGPGLWQGEHTTVRLGEAATATDGGPKP